jgi:hypothetical protein
MRLDDFDSQWHFVPDSPESMPAFRRTNRVMILILAVFLIGLFVAMLAPRPARNSVTATHFGSTPVHNAKVLAPQHAAAPAPEPR